MTDAAEKTMKAAQMLLAERGYMVFGIKPGNPVRYKIGEVINECRGYDLGQPFRIVAMTTKEDWIEQCRLVSEQQYGVEMSPSTIIKAHEGGPFYKAVTD
jgi:hypothetical protein